MARGVCMAGGACMAGGHVWWGACVAAGSMHGRGHTCIAGRHAWQEAGETSTAVDSMHRTGMHSCTSFSPAIGG